MIWARLSRSARICFSMASRMSRGGLMSCSSTRFTFTPHLLLASSRMLAQLGVDGVAAGKALVQVQFADHVTQGGLGQLFDGQWQVLDLVHRLHGVHDLEVEQGVDLRAHVVLGDHVLLGEVVHGLAQVDAFLLHELHVLVAIGQVAAEAVR